MAQTNLDADQQLVRNVTKTKWVEVAGEVELFPAAFRLRAKDDFKPPRSQDEKYLSASWLDYFEGDFDEQIKKFINVVNSSEKYKLRKSAVLAVCKVGALQEVGAKHDVSIKARHNPKEWNPAYSGIHGMSVVTQTDVLLNEIVAVSVSRCVKVCDLIAEEENSEAADS